MARTGRPLSTQERDPIFSLMKQKEGRFIHRLTNLFYLRCRVVGEPDPEAKPYLGPVKHLLLEAKNQGLDPAVVYETAVRLDEAYPEHGLFMGYPSYEDVKPA